MNNKVCGKIGVKLITGAIYDTVKSQPTCLLSGSLDNLKKVEMRIIKIQQNTISTNTADINNF